MRLSSAVALSFLLSFYIFIVPVTFSERAEAGQGQTRDEGSVQESDTLSDLIKPYHHPEVYDRALKILKSLESSPSCNRLATATLLTSCKTLEGIEIDANHNLDSNEIALDRIKSLYAARLAVCELLDAKAPVPPQCMPIMPLTEQDRRSFGLGFVGHGPRIKNPSTMYEQISEEKASQCLKALETRPQSWTSYSNARQNAAIMCSASRNDIDKDDLIKLHTSLTSVTSNISSIIFESLHEASERLMAQQNFFEQVDLLNTRLLRDIEHAHSRAEGLIVEMANGMTSALNTVVTSFSDDWATTGSDVENVKRAVHDTHLSVNGLQQKITELIHEIDQESSQLLEKIAAENQAGHSKALALQNVLSEVTTSGVGGLEHALESVQLGLKLSNDFAKKIHDRQIFMHQHMVALNLSFHELEIKADKISMTQAFHAENQSRFNQIIVEEMHAIDAMLAQISSSASSLQDMIDDASTKISVLGISSFAVGPWLCWAIICYLVISLPNNGIPKYLILLVGAGLLTTTLFSFAPIVTKVIPALNHFVGGSDYTMVTASLKVLVAGLCVALLFFGVNAAIRRSKTLDELRFDQLSDPELAHG